MHPFNERWIEILRAEETPRMGLCHDCNQTVRELYAEKDRAATAERDLAEARAEIERLKQQASEEHTRTQDRIQSLFDERTEVWDKIRADRAALATERATTAQVLADAERFVALLMASNQVAWGFGKASSIATLMQADELLTALRSARGVGEE